MKYYKEWLYDKYRLSLSDQESMQDQMHIGYMMEYLFEKGYNYRTVIPEVPQLFKGLKIEGVYNWLKNTIEENKMKNIKTREQKILWKLK